MMTIKLMLVVLLALSLLGVIGMLLGRRRYANQAGRVRKLKNPEWSSTVYGCAESRAEF